MINCPQDAGRLNVELRRQIILEEYRIRNSSIDREQLLPDENNISATTERCADPNTRTHARAHARMLVKTRIVGIIL